MSEIEKETSSRVCVSAKRKTGMEAPSDGGAAVAAPDMPCADFGLAHLTLSQSSSAEASVALKKHMKNPGQHGPDRGKVFILLTLESCSFRPNDPWMSTSVFRVGSCITKD
jgi:hypothetical protein